jgi:hypothetical protein
MLLSQPRCDLEFNFLFVCLMVFKATFNNISVISWWSVLLVEETGENHCPVASHWQTLSYNVVHLAMSRFKLATSVVVGTDCIGSCKSNYHAITTTMSPPWIQNMCTFDICRRLCFVNDWPSRFCVKLKEHCEIQTTLTLN